MAKRERLTPIPKHKPARRARAGVHAPAPAAVLAAPDLAHIAESLRPLAVPVERLQLHPKNPRRHSEAHLEQLAGSLRVNGQAKNLVASTRTDPPTIVCGNGTYRAALLLGWTHVAASLMPLSEARENQLAMIDNVTGADPDWDDQAVKDLLADVDTGNDEVLDKMLAELAEECGIVEKDDNDNDNDKASANVDAKIVCPECGHEFEAP